MDKKITRCKRLFDTIKKESGIDTFALVAKSVDINAPALSNMSAGRLQISDAVIIRIMDVYGMSLARIRSLMD